MTVKHTLGDLGGAGREMTMKRIVLGAAVACFAMIGLAGVAGAQTIETVRVTRGTVVLETPRGDSIPVASIVPGQMLDVLDRQGNWLRVAPADGANAKPDWEQGWIHASSIEIVSQGPAAAPRTSGRTRIRGFGQAGGTLFSAHDSFDTILGNQFGVLLGGGGQVSFRSGAFVQVAIEQFQETGSRALVAGNQLFTVDIPARITVKPVLFTVGYRSETHPRYAPYLGAGLGWHTLTEESPTLAASDTIRKGKIGYHVLGGAEFPLGRWMSVAGEVQWATVPKALGGSGLSAVFGEDDLGGTSFRFKFLVGY